MPCNTRKAIICLAIMLTIITSSGLINPSFAKENETEVIKNSSEYAMFVSGMADERIDNTSFNTNASTNNTLLIVCDRVLDFTEVDGVEGAVYNGDDLCVVVFDSSTNARKAYNTIKKLDGVKSVEYNQEVNYIQTVNNENHEYSIKTIGNHHTWGAEDIGIDCYTDKMSINGEDIIVAVVDSGIDKTNDLYSDKLLQGYDFVEGDDEANDEVKGGHGTHVAGIIADCTKEQQQIKIMPIRVINGFGVGENLDVANGILYAIDNNVDVINVSLGGTHSEYIDTAVKKAIARGITVVVAAGNNGRLVENKKDCPAHLKEVITVGSINESFELSDFSNYGEVIDFVAPGENILSAGYRNSLVEQSGTSMAAPHIAACAALLKANYDEISEKNLYSVLLRACESKLPRDKYGNGKINLRKLVADIEEQEIAVDNTSCIYSGKAQIPKINVVSNNQSLFNGSDYTLEFENNVNVGTATAKVYGAGTYSGSSSVDFTINPAGTSISSIKSYKKKSCQIEWKKNTKQTDGYEIRYSLYSSMKKSSTKKIASNKKTKLQVNNLKSKKKYYFQVRTYTKKSDEMYYSKWSKAKGISVK